MVEKEPPVTHALAFFKKECTDGLPVHVCLAVKQKLSSPNTALLFLSLDDVERSAYFETWCPRAAVLQEGDNTPPPNWVYSALFAEVATRYLAVVVVVVVVVVA